jgi:hypothetical protein
VAYHPRKGGRRPTVSGDEPPDDDQPFGDLSGVAREAVRQGADPRLDAHLARLGLTGDAAPASRPARASDPAADDAARQASAELAASVTAMASRLAALETQVQRLGGAIQLIGAFGVAAAVLAVVALALALR